MLRRRRNVFTMNYLFRERPRFFCALAFSLIASAALCAAQDSAPADYDFPITNGLLATVAGYQALKDVKAPDLRTYKLRPESFCDKIQVSASIQRNAAPLAVVLLGIYGKADHISGKLWASWLSQAGYHVLVMDSTFQTSFNAASCQGVTGNIGAESLQVSRVIAAFNELPEMRGKVTQIGVVGMSYGGVEALILGKMSVEGKLPIRIDAVQAYSPPLNLYKSGQLVDDWFNHDRWQYTLADLQRMLVGMKIHNGQPPPEVTDSVLRAGIAASMEMDLADVVLYNDAKYKLRRLPEGGGYNDNGSKRDYAATWGYGKFISEMVYPYWQGKMKIESFDEFIGMLDVARLLDKQPAVAQLIITADDPLNAPEDLATVKARDSSSTVIVLPRGGHLGYIGNRWVKGKLQSLFERPAQRQLSSKTIVE